MKNSFKNVGIVHYHDSLEITEVEPIINYVKSFTNNKTVLHGNNLEGFRKYLKEILNTKGKITVKKNTGIFIAKNPIK